MNSNHNTVWWLRYVLVIIVALILGAALGELGFFRTTNLGFLKLTAGKLVQFLGYSCALVMLWLLGQRAALEMAKRGDWQKPASHFMVPLTTVIVVPASHPVLLLVLGGVLGPNLRKIYDWLFILGTLAAAAWLVMMLFQRLDELQASLRQKESDQTSN